MPARSNNIEFPPVRSKFAKVTNNDFCGEIPQKSLDPPPSLSPYGGGQTDPLPSRMGRFRPPKPNRVNDKTYLFISLTFLLQTITHVLHNTIAIV